MIKYRQKKVDLLSSCSFEKSPSESNFTSGKTGELGLGGSFSSLGFFFLKNLKIDGFSFSFVDFTSMKTWSSLRASVFSDIACNIDGFNFKYTLRIKVASLDDIIRLYGF